MRSFLLQLKRRLIECGSLALLGIECLRDYLRMVAHCKASPFVSRAAKRRYDTIIMAHTVEKGLSLPLPRPLFGQPRIKEIMNNIECMRPAFDEFSVSMAIGAFEAYVDMHRHQQIGDQWIDQVEGFSRRIQALSSVSPNGGTKRIEECFRKIQSRSLDYDEFIRSRSSVRNFDSRPVSDDVVESIVKTAQAAPSQCNRQSSRAHFFRRPSDIAALLKLQGGAIGFSNEVPQLFVVTNEMTAWSGARERNQAYVDGALFAMALLYSCHSLGVAACPLNLAVTNSREAAIRRAGKIPNGEKAIMMIAFGWPALDGVVAARSPRLPLNAVLTIHAD